MDTQLLTRILQEAQDRAPNASEADAIRCLAVDLDTLDAAMMRQALSIDEIISEAAKAATLRKIIETQPWEVREDEEAGICIDELTPGAFEKWLADLEYEA